MPVDLHTMETKSLSAEKESPSNLLVEEHTACHADKKRRKSVDICMEQHFHYVKAFSRVLKYVTACCACETSKMCPYNLVQK